MNILLETADGRTVHEQEMGEVELIHTYICECWICSYKRQQRAQLEVTYEYSLIGMFNNGWKVIMPQPDDNSLFK